MMFKPALAAAALALPSLATATPQDASLTTALARQINVHYDVLANGLDAAQCAPLGADGAACYRASVTLANTGPAISGKSWAIYFSSIRRILKVDSSQFRITPLTGDLYCLQPTELFTGFGANTSVTIPLVLEYWQVSMYDTMPRWFVKVGDARALVIANTNTEDLTRFVEPLGKSWQRSADDANVLMDAGSRFDLYSQTPTLPSADFASRIIPQPLQQQLTGGSVNVANGLRLKATGLSLASVKALETRMNTLGMTPRNNALPVTVAIQPDAIPAAARKAEGYSLSITPQGVNVIGDDSAGAFYGVQSLLALIDVRSKAAIPAMQMVDAPRFAYRGFMIDEARNFHSKATLLKSIDVMAAYKLNKLHLHLSDDEGWRLQIPGLPELTEVGAKRCLDLSETNCLLPQLGQGPDNTTSGSGFLSRVDFIDILKYAQARNVEVIPEIDMPGHSRAAVIAMEARYRKLEAEGRTTAASEFRLYDPEDSTHITSAQFYDRMSMLNPCLQSTLAFTDKVISEIALMYKDAGVTLNTWHFGSDEAKNIFLGAGYADKSVKDNAGKGQIDLSEQDPPWGKSPACQELVKAGKVANLEHLPAYFAHEVSGLLPKYGIPTVQAWQDGLKFAPNAKDFPIAARVNTRDTLFRGGADSALALSKKGFGVILSNPDYLYLDFPHEVDPQERGYYWGARSNPVKKIFTFTPENLPQNAETSLDRDGKAFEIKSGAIAAQITGVSAQLWSETIRTDAQYEYMVFPRMLAVAERAWHKAAWELPYLPGAVFKADVTHRVDAKAWANDYANFVNVLGQRELAKLDQSAVAYRLPMVGARLVNGKLAAVAEFPGVQIQYSLDAGKKWQTFDATTAAPIVADENTVQVRSVSQDGRRTGRATGLD